MLLIDPADLVSRWHGRERFAVLLDGFGDGTAVDALRAAWRADPGRCARLDVVAIDPSPVPGAWPPATPDLHQRTFEGGGVRLLLATFEARCAWRELVAAIDLFLIGEAAHDALGLAKALVRLAAPEAEVRMAHAPPPLRAGLRAAGFEATSDGPPFAARYRPSFVPSRAPVRRVASATADRHAVIVGAGLAGAATALALAREGWTSTLLDRRAAPALEASGNPAGLFHGIVTPDDGPHARFNRAAAWAAHDVVTSALERHGVRGDAHGLLRLERADASVPAMQALLARLHLGAGYVRAVDAAEASGIAGVPVDRPAWFYPGGGWVDPAGLVRAMLADTGDRCRFVGGAPVHRIARADGRWSAFDAEGLEVARGDALVVANASAAADLVDRADWPLKAVRGQLSLTRTEEELPRVPIAGGGYVMPPVAGWRAFGATAQVGDFDGTVREADHHHNLLVHARLLPQSTAPALASLSGRTAWRCVADDRLPLIGEVPAHAPVAAQLRFTVRQPGLFVFTGLGSRGITWCALGGQVLAAAIAGGPSPLPASLLDAVDPARFASRAARRTGPAG